MAELPRLVCKECSYKNEPERVYCHNCGAKLDRSLLPSKEEQKRMAKPKSSIKLRVPIFKPLISVVFLSGLAAAILLAFLRPEYAVEEKGAVSLDTPSIDFDLQNMVAGTLNRPRAYTETQLNSYLKSSIRAKEDGALSDYIRFERAFLVLEDGYAGICLEQSAFGYSFFVRSDYRPVVGDAGIASENLGGAFGRLDIPPALMRHLDIVLSHLFRALERDLGNLSQCGDVVVAEDSAVVYPPGVRARR